MDAHQSAPAPARAPEDSDTADILAAHDAGLSQTEAARRLGLNRPALSRWSRRRGLFWGVPPAAAMQQAERLRMQREQLAYRTLADALHLRQQLWADEPPSARDIRDLAAAIESLVRVSDHATEQSAPGVERARSMVSRLGAQLGTYVRDHYGEDPSDAVDRTPTGSPGDD